MLEGITGFKNIHDDILVYGVDEKDHYRALSEVFNRLRESELTLKRNKCDIRQVLWTYLLRSRN